MISSSNKIDNAICLDYKNNNNITTTTTTTTSTSTIISNNIDSNSVTKINTESKSIIKGLAYQDHNYGVPLQQVTQSPPSKIKTLLAAAAISSPYRFNALNGLNSDSDYSNDKYLVNKNNNNNNATLLSAPSSSTEQFNKLNITNELKMDDAIVMNSETSSIVSTYTDEEFDDSEDEEDDDDNESDDDDDEEDDDCYYDDDDDDNDSVNGINNKKSTDITRCICEMNHDDGYMICCDKCQVWQHIICMGIHKNKIPEKYFCELCEPRIVNQTKAKITQKKYLDDLKKNKNKKKQKQKKYNNKKFNSTRTTTTTANKIKIDNLKKYLYDEENDHENDSDDFNNNNNNGDYDEISTSNASEIEEYCGDDNNNVKNGNYNHVIDSNSDNDLVSNNNKKLINKNGKFKENNNNKLKRTSSGDKTNKKPTKMNILDYNYKEIKSNQYLDDSLKILLKLDQSTYLGISNFDQKQQLNGNGINNLNRRINYNGVLKTISSDSIQLVKTRTPWRIKTTCIIKQNQTIIEYIGKIILINEELSNEQINKINETNTNKSASCLSPLASSSTTTLTNNNNNNTSTNCNINNQNSPFMIYYTNYMNFKLCIDSSVNGNIARFIRKSCTPNCHLEHFIENGQIHFVVISTNHIPRGAELTLPYDNIQDLRYCFCNCNKSKCTLKKEIKLFLQRNKRPYKRRHESSTDKLSDSNSVVKRKNDNNELSENMTNNKKSTAVATKTSTQQEQQQPVTEQRTRRANARNRNSNENQTTGGLSREDRKLISYVKVIEKLEKQGKRKQQREAAAAAASLLTLNNNSINENLNDESSCHTTNIRKINEEKEIIWQAKVNKEPKTSHNKNKLNNSKPNTSNNNPANINSTNLNDHENLLNHHVNNSPIKQEKKFNENIKLECFDNENIDINNNNNNNQLEKNYDNNCLNDVKPLNETVNETANQTSINATTNEISSNKNICLLNSDKKVNEIITSTNTQSESNNDLNSVDFKDFKNKKQMASIYTTAPKSPDYSFVDLSIEPRQTLNLLKRNLPMLSPSSVCSQSSVFDTNSQQPAKQQHLETNTLNDSSLLNKSLNNDTQQCLTLNPKKRWLKCSSMDQANISENSNNSIFQFDNLRSISNIDTQRSCVASPLSDNSDTCNNLAPLKKRRYLYTETNLNNELNTNVYTTNNNNNQNMFLISPIDNTNTLLHQTSPLQPQTTIISPTTPLTAIINNEYNAQFNPNHLIFPTTSNTTNLTENLLTTTPLINNAYGLFNNLLTESNNSNNSNNANLVNLSTSLLCETATFLLQQQQQQQQQQCENQNDNNQQYHQTFPYIDTTSNQTNTILSPLSTTPTSTTPAPAAYNFLDNNGSFFANKNYLALYSSNLLATQFSNPSNEAIMSPFNDPQKRKKVSLAEYRQRKEKPSLPQHDQHQIDINNMSNLETASNYNSTENLNDITKEENIVYTSPKQNYDDAMNEENNCDTDYRILCGHDNHFEETQNETVPQETKFDWNTYEPISMEDDSESNNTKKTVADKLIESLAETKVESDFSIPVDIDNRDKINDIVDNIKNEDSSIDAVMTEKLKQLLNKLVSQVSQRECMEVTKEDEPMTEIKVVLNEPISESLTEPMLTKNLFSPKSDKLNTKERSRSRSASSSSTSRSSSRTTSSSSSSTSTKSSKTKHLSKRHTTSSSSRSSSATSSGDETNKLDRTHNSRSKHRRKNLKTKITRKQNQLNDDDCLDTGKVQSEIKTNIITNNNEVNDKDTILVNLNNNEFLVKSVKKNRSSIYSTVSSDSLSSSPDDSTDDEEKLKKVNSVSLLTNIKTEVATETCEPQAILDQTVGSPLKLNNSNKQASDAIRNASSSSSSEHSENELEMKKKHEKPRIRKRKSRKDKNDLSRAGRSSSSSSHSSTSSSVSTSASSASSSSSTSASSSSSSSVSSSHSSSSSEDEDENNENVSKISSRREKSSSSERSTSSVNNYKKSKNKNNSVASITASSRSLSSSSLMSLESANKSKNHLKKSNQYSNKDMKHSSHQHHNPHQTHNNHHHYHHNNYRSYYNGKDHHYSHYQHKHASNYHQTHLNRINTHINNRNHHHHNNHHHHHHHQNHYQHINDYKYKHLSHNNRSKYSPYNTNHHHSHNLKSYNHRHFQKHQVFNSKSPYSSHSNNNSNNNIDESNLDDDSLLNGTEPTIYNPRMNKSFLITSLGAAVAAAACASSSSTTTSTSANSSSSTIINNSPTTTTNASNNQTKRTILVPKKT